METDGGGGGGRAGVRFDDKGRKRGDTGPLRRGRPLSRDRISHIFYDRCGVNRLKDISGWRRCRNKR